MRRYAVFAILVGLLGVLLSWSTLWCAEIIQDAFATNSVLGFLTLGGFSLFGSGICYLCVHELRGYLSIRCVDRLAIALHSEDVLLAKKRSTHWLNSQSQECRMKAIQSATTMEELNAILIPYVDAIDSKVDGIIAKESVLTGAVVGISPWPLIDGIVVGWRQLRLMRVISAEYGVRPSALGTCSLLRRVLISVAFADASEHITSWLAAKVPSLGGLIPSAGQAVATAVLTVRLGRSCKTACRPLKKAKKQSQSCLTKLKIFLRRSVLQNTQNELNPPASGRF